jgi:hypothetical protein
MLCGSEWRSERQVYPETETETAPTEVKKITAEEKRVDAEEKEPGERDALHPQQ